MKLFGREFKASEDVFSLKIREFFQEIFDGIACGEVFEKGFYCIAKTANDGFTVAGVGLDSNAIEKAHNRI